MAQIGMLSSREINRARRKARQAMSKQRSREAGEDGGTSSVGEDPDHKKPKLEEVKQEDLSATGLLTNGSVPDSTGSWGEVRTLRIWFHYAHYEEELVRFLD